ncbi:UPF0149 family protein [Thermomonas sp.]|uniref:UPF0149 family protein n=1 Tax=Thermomonas sp. TaxID=1971895 RepID=UPI00260D117F|nr:UPF0149 family protein [Thermomonas sp.]
MSDNELPSWDDVQDAADRLLLSSSPAELHGGLCGWLAGGGMDSAGWLALVLADPALPTPAQGDVLDRLRTASALQLADLEFGFQPLLPDFATVTARADALFAWCRGFLGGFGLACGDKPLSEESQEALNDLAGLAAAELDDEEEGNDEESLAEIEEYLRMAVLLLHADCVLGAQHRQRLH